jgi:hypothetical protein
MSILGVHHQKKCIIKNNISLGKHKLASPRRRHALLHMPFVVSYFGLLGMDLKF